MSKIDRLVQSELADRSPGYQEETLETAGCTGQCPNYPGANKTEDGYPDCSGCPESEGQKEIQIIMIKSKRICTEKKISHTMAQRILKQLKTNPEVCEDCKIKPCVLATYLWS